MSDEIKPKKRIPKYDRVTLYEESLRKVDAWIKQVESSKSGVSLFRKDILNWVILNSAEVLTIANVESMATQFFDQERFLKQALRKVCEAKKRGENLSLKDIMADEQSVKVKKTPKLRSPVKPNAEDTSSANKEILTP
jgi:hypothetical protein